MVVIKDVSPLSIQKFCQFISVFLLLFSLKIPSRVLQANIVVSSCCSGLKKQNYSNNSRKTCSETYENSSDDHICGLKTVIETFYRTIAKGTTGTKASNIGIARENEKKEGSK